MIQPLGDRVLVALPPAPDETVTASGIVLTRDPDKFFTPTRGIVVQLGRKSNTCDVDEARSVVHTYFVESAEFPANFRKLGDEIDRLLMRLLPAPFDVQVGDCIVFSPSAGQAVELDGIDYVILSEAEILGIVEPSTSEAA